MLPWIIGGIIGVTITLILSDSEEEKKEFYSKKLKREHDTYGITIEKKVYKNEQKKRKILFNQIKDEQSRLKKERRKLYSMMNNMERNSIAHKKLQHQINHLGFLINKKQQDADRVKKL